jgi:outer membrane protein OmpA-like peptidoglycan-associated protein
MAYITSWAETPLLGELGCGSDCRCTECRRAYAGLGERYVKDDDDEAELPPPRPGLKPARASRLEGALPSPPVPVPTPVQPTLVLDHFRINQSTLLPGHPLLLNQLAQKIVESWQTMTPVRVVRLIGHTDISGPDRYNLALGQRRALEAKNHLKVEIDRLHPDLSGQIAFSTSSLGESRPLRPANTAEGNALNRRVEILLDAPGPRFGEVPATSAPGSAVGCSNPLDRTARGMIAAAQDPNLSVDVRGVQVVWNILRTYYPTEAIKVSRVVYVDSTPGLATTSIAGPPITGEISVGRNFVNGTNPRFFARRVLQVGHELQHIDQWRAGMGGPARRAEREFLAHCWAALTPEKPGTACMPHATRVAIIDAALGNLNCLSGPTRAAHAQREAILLALRMREQAASGGPATAPPTTCMISH